MHFSRARSKLSSIASAKRSHMFLQLHQRQRRLHVVASVAEPLKTRREVWQRPNVPHLPVAHRAARQRAGMRHQSWLKAQRIGKPLLGQAAVAHEDESMCVQGCSAQGRYLCDRCSVGIGNAQCQGAAGDSSGCRSLHAAQRRQHRRLLARRSLEHQQGQGASPYKDRHLRSEHCSAHLRQCREACNIAIADQRVSSEGCVSVHDALVLRKTVAEVFGVLGCAAKGGYAGGLCVRGVWSRTPGVPNAKGSQSPGGPNLPRVPISQGSRTPGAPNA